MRVLTLDRLTPSTLAAWRKFKCSATANAWIKDAKGMREPRGERIPFPPWRVSFFDPMRGKSAHRPATNGSPRQCPINAEIAAGGAAICKKRQFDGCGSALLDGLKPPMPIQVGRGESRIGGIDQNA